MNVLKINIPFYFDIFIIKNNNNLKLILCNNKHTISLSIDNSINFYINNNTNSLIMEKNSYNFKNNLTKNVLENYIKLLNTYFFIKIKFKGKGYKIKIFKKKKILSLYFNKSHINLFKLIHIYIKKINKYKFLLKSNNIYNLKKLSKLIIHVRPLNIYTLRGLRISKQIVLKRKGKKNAYL